MCSGYATINFSDNTTLRVVGANENVWARWADVWGTVSGTSSTASAALRLNLNNTVTNYSNTSGRFASQSLRCRSTAVEGEESGKKSGKKQPKFLSKP